MAVVGVLVNIFGTVKVVFYTAAIMGLINVILVFMRVKISQEEA